MIDGLEAVGSLAIERFGALGIAGAIDVAVGKGQPQVPRLLGDEPLEDAGAVGPQALLERDLVEAVGRVVVVRCLREAGAARCKRIGGGLSLKCA